MRNKEHSVCLGEFLCIIILSISKQYTLNLNAQSENTRDIHSNFRLYSFALHYDHAGHTECMVAL